jgi:hypothetical protein
MFSRKSDKKPGRKQGLGSRFTVKPEFLGPLRTSAVDTSITSLEEWSQVRRCHKCGGFHEQHAGRVLKCSDCGAHFAPFFYSELTPDALAVGCPESLVISSAKNYRPLVGLTWWWTDLSTDAGESVMPRA